MSAAAERPADRLRQHGASVLTDRELLAILLPTTHEMACPLGDGGIANLLHLDLCALRSRGLGDIEATVVLAAVELARRLTRARMPERRPMSDAATAARYLELRYARTGQEIMGAIYLDAVGNIIVERELFAGGLARVQVEPQLVLKEALLQDAAAVVVFHNHPSGDPEPSPEDIAFTRRLVRACAVMGIDLVDHLVLANGHWVSMRERRLI